MNNTLESIISSLNRSGSATSYANWDVSWIFNSSKNLSISKRSIASYTALWTKQARL